MGRTHPDLTQPALVALARSCPWPDGDPLPVAVSGGPDSMALVVLARTMGRDVTAHHVDHGLRVGSAAEVDRVEAEVRRVGAAFTSTRVDVGPGPNVEARARRLRYAALPAGVLTGHTADDRAETVLLNILRGAALDGLAPMAGSGRAVRRPLLGLRRAQTVLVCQLAGVEPLHDPSNRDLALRRNAVRHRVLPLLAEVAGRDLVPVLARQAELLAEDASLLDALALEVDPTDARALAEAPVALARRAVRRWLRQASDDECHPPSAAEVARVLGVAAGETVATEVAGGRRVRRSRGILIIDAPTPFSLPPEEIHR